MRNKDNKNADASDSPGGEVLDTSSANNTARPSSARSKGLYPALSDNPPGNWRAYDVI